jgi:hypothetical protein
MLSDVCHPSAGSMMVFGSTADGRMEIGSAPSEDARIALAAETIPVLTRITEETIAVILEIDKMITDLSGDRGVAKEG